MQRELLLRYLRTPAGCDGGNIRGQNWLFAIEYGGEGNLSDFHYLEVNPEHRFIPEDEVAKFIGAYPFNRRIAKFEAAKHGRRVEDYREFATEVRMFSPSSQYYKGNIGAFQFRHDDQVSFEEAGQILGIRTKDELKNLEMESRAPMFREWVSTFSPACICCFGTTDAERFIAAFSDVPERTAGWRKLDGLRYYHDLVNEGRTNLFILPHPTAPYGRGLSHDARIARFGKMVRETMLRNGFDIV